MEACPRPLHHDDACSHLINNPQSIVIKVLQLTKRRRKEYPKEKKYMLTTSTSTMKIKRISSLDSYLVMRAPSELVEDNPSYDLPMVAPSNQGLPGVHRSE